MSDTTAVQIEIIDALLADAGVMGLIGDRIISGVPGEGYPLPYVRLSASDELDAARLGRNPTSGVESFDVFSRDVDHLEVKAVYEAMRNVLHNRRFTLSTGRAIRGRLTLLTTMNDPTGEAHAVVRYTWRPA